MRSHSRRRAAGISIGVPLLALCAFLFRDAIADFAASDRFPSCRFFQLTGYLCPACGNTRAALELLHGHLLRSLGYNPMIVVFGLMLLCLYGEAVCLALGKPRQFLPKRAAPLITVVCAVLLFDILRNFFPALTLCI